MITWLTGITRVKEQNYTKEVSGYRCSGCRHFELYPLRNCPNCGGEYMGKLLNQGGNNDVE